MVTRRRFARTPQGVAARARRSAAQCALRRRAGSRGCRPTTRSRSSATRSTSSSAFPGGRRTMGPGQAEALLRIDARFEPAIAELTAQYTANYQRSSSVETRLWHAVFDLVKAFIAAYQAALKSGIGSARKSAGRPSCPGCWFDSRTTRDSTATSGCSATATGSRRNGGNSTSCTNSRASMAGSASRSRPTRDCSAAPGSTLESEYIKTLLLMRLDSGNFTPDQVEWVARQLDEWVPPLALTPPPGTGANFFVDLSGTQGLRRAGPAARRRADDVSRCGSGLRAHRRAHALAAGSGRGSAPAGRTAAARAEAAADAARGAVRARRAGLLAARRRGRPPKPTFASSSACRR